MLHQTTTPVQSILGLVIGGGLHLIIATISRGATTVLFTPSAPGSTPGRIGRIAVGVARQGYDLQLTRYDERGWRATFYTTGREHSPPSATGTG